MPIVTTVLLVFALGAFFVGTIMAPPPTGRVNYIAMGLAFATLAFLLRG